MPPASGLYTCRRGLFASCPRVRLVYAACRCEIMPDASSSRSVRWLLAINACLLGGILVSMVTRDRSMSLAGAAFAQQQLPIGGGAGFFIVPGQFAANRYGCYIMDVDAQTLCVYMFDPTGRQLHLVAARSFKNDRRLENFNTAEPSPADVLEILRKEAASARVLEQPKPENQPETPPEKPE